MKLEDCSNTKNDNSQPEISEKLMGRREVISKAGLFALSAATMMVLLKSQPAKAQSSQLNMPAPNISPSSERWERTTRSNRM